MSDSTEIKNTGSGLPRVSLTSDLSLDLYAVSGFLGTAAGEKLHLLIPFDVILQDPLVLEENPDLASDDEFRVKWEPGLIDGPTSARFAVEDYDSDTEEHLAPAKWDAARRTFTHDGRDLDTKSIDLPQFHQVNLWAMLQNALAFFESGFGLGRPIPWGFEGNRLTVVPHAGNGQNAAYDRKSKSLKFYYSGREGGRLYTCLSADIVYHEFGHAVLDGVRPLYSESATVQTGAFHEFMGDISAILLSLKNKKFRHTIAAQTDGDIGAADNLTSIAEEFGRKTENRPFLRTATNNAKMRHMAGQTSVHRVSQVMTGAMFDILEALTAKYLEREKTRFEEGETTRRPSVKRVFARAVERMQRFTVQPLDLLPPVDVSFRDYARAVLRAHELANPLDPFDYYGMILDVFVKRGILDQEDRKELTADRYLYQRERLPVYHDIDEISRSRAAAYRFVHDNREQLYIPLGVDLVIADLYDAQKYNRTGLRLPRQIVLEYVWREVVLLDGARFGRFEGKITHLLCGATIVFDGTGNILSWLRKPGTAMKADEERLGWPGRRESKIKAAWYAELAAGEQRQKTFLDELAARIADGQFRMTAGAERALAAGGPVSFRLSPHLRMTDDDAENTGERQWQIGD